MRKILIAVCVIVGLGVMPVSSQETTWQVTLLYTTETGNIGGILVVEAGGEIRDIPLLNLDLSPVSLYSEEGVYYRISSDYRYLVAASSEIFYQSDFVPPFVLDLQELEAEDWLWPLVEQYTTMYNVGTFLPDTTLIPVAIHDPETFTAHILIVDAASHTVTADYTIDDTPYAILLDDWDGHVLRFSPFNLGDAPAAGIVKTLDIDTGEIQRTDEFYDHFLIDRLPTTREYLYANFAPILEEFQGEFDAPPNVIEYYSSGTPAGWYAPVEHHPIVYVDLLEWSWHFPRARWVLDGQAFLMEDGSTIRSVLVYRDGTQITLPDRIGSFLVGTPEGWLAQGSDGETQTLYYVTIENQQSVFTPIHRADSYAILEAPLMGASVTDLSFAPDTKLYTIGNCSTLEAGQHFMLSSSGGIILRENLVDGYPVGDLLGGEPFEILEGPVCVNDRIYWQVTDGFNVGWIQEADFTPTDQAMPAIPEGLGECGDFVSRLRYAADASSQAPIPAYPIPSFEAEPMKTIPAGEGLYLREGPVCSEGTVWWSIWVDIVDNKPVVGWIAEGNENGYWLEEVPRE